MPYTIRKKSDNKFCVVKKLPDGKYETVHCHNTREQAVKQVQAININENKSASNK